MDEIDLLVICAEGLPPAQALDLFHWWLASTTPAEFRAFIIHPSVKWWVERHGSDVCRYLAEPHLRTT